MIEGTKVANKFEKIYASSFYYDKGGVAQWPAQVVNYTSKTQFLFRIGNSLILIQVILLVFIIRKQMISEKSIK